MFYASDILGRKGPLGTIWSMAHGKRLSKNKILMIDLKATCSQILQPDVPHSLRLQGILIGGVVICFSKQQAYLLEDLQDMVKRVQDAQTAGTKDAGAATLQKGKDRANAHAITMHHGDLLEDEALLLGGAPAGAAAAHKPALLRVHPSAAGTHPALASLPQTGPSQAELAFARARMGAGGSDAEDDDDDGLFVVPPAPELSHHVERTVGPQGQGVAGRKRSRRATETTGTGLTDLDAEEALLGGGAAPMRVDSRSLRHGTTGDGTGSNALHTGGRTALDDENEMFGDGMDLMMDGFDGAFDHDLGLGEAEGLLPAGTSLLRHQRTDTTTHGGRTTTGRGTTGLGGRSRATTTGTARGGSTAAGQTGSQQQVQEEQEGGDGDSPLRNNSSGMPLSSQQLLQRAREAAQLQGLGVGEDELFGCPPGEADDFLGAGMDFEFGAQGLRHDPSASKGLTCSMSGPAQPGDGSMGGAAAGNAGRRPARKAAAGARRQGRPVGSRDPDQGSDAEEDESEGISGRKGKGKGRRLAAGLTKMEVDPADQMQVNHKVFREWVLDSSELLAPRGGVTHRGLRAAPAQPDNNAAATWEACPEGEQAHGRGPLLVVMAEADQPAPTGVAALMALAAALSAPGVGAAAKARGGKSGQGKAPGGRPAQAGTSLAQALLLPSSVKFVAVPWGPELLKGFAEVAGAGTKAAAAAAGTGAKRQRTGAGHGADADNNNINDVQDPAHVDEPLPPFEDAAEDHAMFGAGDDAGLQDPLSALRAGRSSDVEVERLRAGGAASGDLSAGVHARLGLGLGQDAAAGLLARRGSRLTSSTRTGTEGGLLLEEGGLTEGELGLLGRPRSRRPSTVNGSSRGARTSDSVDGIMRFGSGALEDLLPAIHEYGPGGGHMLFEEAEEMEGEEALFGQSGELDLAAGTEGEQAFSGAPTDARAPSRMTSRSARLRQAQAQGARPSGPASTSAGFLHGSLSGPAQQQQGTLPSLLLGLAGASQFPLAMETEGQTQTQGGPHAGGQAGAGAAKAAGMGPATRLVVEILRQRLGMRAAEVRDHGAQAPAGSGAGAGQDGDGNRHNASTDVTVSFFDLVQRLSRPEAVKLFYQLMVSTTAGRTRAWQEEGFGDVAIGAGPHMGPLPVSVPLEAAATAGA